MKKISFLLLSLPLFAFGQKSPAAFEAYASPNFTYYTKSLVDNDGKLGLSLGVRLVMPSKNERLQGLFGAQVSSYGSQYSSDNLRWGTQHNGEGGFDPDLPSGEPDAFSGRDANYFLEIPLGLRYYLRQGRVSLFLQPAISPMYYLTSRHLMEYSTGGQTEKSVRFDGNQWVRNLNLFGSVGAGVEFSLSENIRLQFIPHAGIQAFSISKDSETGARFYSAGVQAGVRYRVVGGND